MRTVLVRYRTHESDTARNEALVHAVFAELRGDPPAGLSYRVFRATDGTTFVHLAQIDTADGGNPLAALASFARFTAGLRERCVEPPVVLELRPFEHFDALDGAAPR